MRAVRIRTEYLKNPVGIDIKNPRISWNCEDGVKQEAYEIKAIDGDGRELWNSGVVKSDKMHLISYEGPELKSRDQVFYQIRLTENGKAGEWSEKASFEMGLLNSSDWKAEWIRGDYKANKKTCRYGVDCFKKSVCLDSGKTLIKARLYATACGIYEFQINGNKAGESVLAPGYTDYNKRLQYQTIDVTDLVRGCEIVELTAELSSGWYRGSIGAHGLPYQFGKETKLLAQLEVTYEDGTIQTIVTDES